MTNVNGNMDDFEGTRSCKATKLLFSSHGTKSTTKNSRPTISFLNLSIKVNSRRKAILLKKVQPLLCDDSAKNLILIFQRERF